MKKLVKIPCQLMTKDLAVSLKLTEQPYLILIPQSIIYNHGFTSESITFDLAIIDGKLSLIGPSVPGSPRVTQPVEEIVDDIRS